MKATVLVVDDERVFRVMAEDALSVEGFEVRTAATLARARAELLQSTPDVVLLDRRLPDGDGLELLELVNSDGARGPLAIVVTAYGDVENAVTALRAGAADYLTKPVQVTDLVVKLGKALEARGLRDRLELEKNRGHRPPLTEGRSEAEKRVQSQLQSVARSPLTPVLLAGPSGAGKQCAAELLHAMTFGAANDAPFVEVNCAALPDELVESELFGHERGAFTGARATRRGLVEMANGGTLFLDEVSELPERSQAKLLKFLDTMRFRRVGGEREIEVSLRIVVATNQDMASLVEAGSFRADLYHRLGVFAIEIPPLRDRPEDIVDLAVSFASFYANRLNKHITGLSPAARELLLGYPFPGNVRELRNIIERAVILTRSTQLGPEDIILPRTDMPRPRSAEAFFAVELAANDTPPPVDEVSRAYVERVLRHFDGRRMAAAQALGVSYPTFLKRLRELGLDNA